MSDMITPKEYKELKAQAKKYIKEKVFAHAKWNKKMAKKLYCVYCEVLERVKEIETPDNAL